MSRHYCTSIFTVVLSFLFVFKLQATESLDVKLIEKLARQVAYDFDQKIVEPDEYNQLLRYELLPRYQSKSEQKELVIEKSILDLAEGSFEKRLDYRIKHPKENRMNCGEVKALYERSLILWSEIVETIDYFLTLERKDYSNEEEFVAALDETEIHLDQLLLDYDQLNLWRIEEPLVEQSFQVGFRELFSGDTMTDDFYFMTVIKSYNLDYLDWNGLVYRSDESSSRIALPFGMNISVDFAANIKLVRQSSYIGACLSEKNLAIELHLDLESSVYKKRPGLKCDYSFPDPPLSSADLITFPERNKIRPLEEQSWDSQSPYSELLGGNRVDDPILVDPSIDLVYPKESLPDLTTRLPTIHCYEEDQWTGFEIPKNFTLKAST